MKSLTVFALLFALSACAQVASSHESVRERPLSSWPMYQYAPSHNAVFAASGFDASWQQQLGDRVNGGLAIVGNMLYVDSFDHYLYAIDARTGRLRWTRKAGNILMSTPVISHNTVVVGSGESGFLKPDDWTSPVWGRPQGDDILAFDSLSGTPRWRFHTHGEDMPSAAVFGNEAIFANGDLHAYAVNLRSGKLLWQTALPGIVSMSSITTDHGRAFVGTCHNNPHRCFTVALDVRIVSQRVVYEPRLGEVGGQPVITAESLAV